MDIHSFIASSYNLVSCTESPHAVLVLSFFTLKPDGQFLAAAFMPVEARYCTRTPEQAWKTLCHLLLICVDSRKKHSTPGPWPESLFLLK